MDSEYSINSFYNHKMPSQYSVALITINTTTLFMGIWMNALLCFAIWKLKLLNTISYRFILALTTSDIHISLFVQPLYNLEYSQILHKYQYVEEFQVIMQFFAFTMGQYSGIMVVVMSIDRYLHMKYLNQYSSYMTSKRANILIFSGLVLSLVLGILQTSAIFFGLYVHFRICTLLANVVVFFIGISFYCKAFFALKSRVANSNISSNLSSSNGNNIRRADLQFAKGVLVILVSLSLCYFPYFLTGIIISFRIISANSRADIGEPLYIMFYFTIELVLMVPLINALIFFIFNRKFKNYLLSCISCRTAVE